MALLVAAIVFLPACELIDDDPPGGPVDGDGPIGDGPRPEVPRPEVPRPEVPRPEAPPELRHTPYTHLSQVADLSELDPLGTDVEAEALVSWAAGTDDVLAWRILRRVGTEPWRFEFEEGGSPELLVPGIVRAFELEFGEDAHGIRQGTRIVAPTYTDLFFISYVAQEVIVPDDGELPPEWPPLEPPPPDDPMWDEEEYLVGKIDAELLELIAMDPELDWVDVAIGVNGVHELELNAEAAQRFAFHNEAGATLEQIRREILDAHQAATLELLSGPMAELGAMFEPPEDAGQAGEIHPDVLVGAIDATIPVSLLHTIADLPWVSAIWSEETSGEGGSGDNDGGLPPLTPVNAAFGHRTDRDLEGIPARGRIATFRRHGIDTFHLAGLSGNHQGRSRFSPMRVGVLDAGIAPQHQAWHDRRGQTRVTDLWDCGRWVSCNRCSLTRTSICGRRDAEHGMYVAGLVGGGMPYPQFSWPIDCEPSGQRSPSAYACCSMSRDPDTGLCDGPYLSEREHRLARAGVAPDAELLHASVGAVALIGSNLRGVQKAQRGALTRMLNHDSMAVGTSVYSRVLPKYPCPTRSTPPFQAATRVGIHAGVPFFALAGNEGRDSGNRHGCTIQRPSVFWSAFAVGSVNVHSRSGMNLGVEDYSSTGPQGTFNPTIIDLVAPGSHGLMPQTRPPSDVHPVPAHYRGAEGRGTSYAQPIATGTYVLLRELLRSVGSPMEGEVGAIPTYLHATAEPFISLEEPYPYNEEEGAGLMMAVLPDPAFGNLTPPFDIHMSSHRVRPGQRVEVIANPDGEGKHQAMPISRLYNRSVHTFWYPGRHDSLIDYASNGPRVQMTVNLLASGERSDGGASGHESCPPPRASLAHRAPMTRDSLTWRNDNKGRIRLNEHNTRGSCQVASFQSPRTSTSVYYTRIFTSEPEDGERDPAWIRFVNLMPPENPPVRVEVVQETEDGRWTSLRTPGGDGIESGMTSSALPVRPSPGPAHFRADWAVRNEAVTTRLGLDPGQHYTAYLVPECGGPALHGRWRGRIHLVAEDLFVLAAAWHKVSECVSSPDACNEEGILRFLNAIPLGLRAGVLDLRMEDLAQSPRELSPVLDPAGTLTPGDENVTSLWYPRQPNWPQWYEDPEYDRVAMMREEEQAYVTENCILNPFCSGDGPPLRMNCEGVRCSHDPDPLAEILGEELLTPEVIRRACTISPTVVRLPARPSPPPPPILQPPGGITGPLPDLPEPIIFPPSLPPLSPFPPLNAPGFVAPIQAMDSFAHDPCPSDHEAVLEAWNREIRLRVTCAWPQSPELP